MKPCAIEVTGIIIMKITLYPYQTKFVDDLLKSFVHGKHLIGYAKCGFGKSYCISEIARRSSLKNKKVLILTHRLILLRQNNGALAEFGNEMVVINDEDKNMDTTHHLYCSTVQTIQSRLKKEGFLEWLGTFDLMINDECHLQHSNFLFKTGILDDTYVIGLTGSPKRNGNMRQLGMDYDFIVSSLPTKELIDIGKLVPCRYFEVPIDISGIKVDPMTGDFQSKSQYKKFDSPEIYGKMIWNYKKHGESRQFVCFCSNIPHAIKTCLEFIKEGIQTKFVVSNLNKPKEPKEKEGGEWERFLDHSEAYELLQANKHLQLHQSLVNKSFESDEIQGVICIDILSIGWDFKPLSCEIINRATQSLPLLIQFYGRVQRPSKEKEYSIVLDMGTNVARLGEAEKEMPVSLWHETNDAVSIPPTKICEGKDKKCRLGCGRVVLASLSMCKCGFRFSTDKELRDIELVERLVEEPQRLKEMSIEGLKAFAELRGYKKTWIWRQLWIRGESEFRNGMRLLGYNNNFIYRQQKLYSK